MNNETTRHVNPHWGGVVVCLQVELDVPSGFDSFHQSSILCFVRVEDTDVCAVVVIVAEDDPLVECDCGDVHDESDGRHKPYKCFWFVELSLDTLQDARVFLRKNILHLHHVVHYFM